MNDVQAAPSFASGDYANRGFRYAEAAQCVEFCVELDGQNERRQHDGNALFVPMLDGRRWNPEPVFDSRQAVAHDVLAYNGGRIGDDCPWSGLYRNILKRALRDPPQGWNIEAFARDPRYNGFAPGGLAWTLHEGRGENAGTFMIAIRGSISSQRPDALRDFIFQPVRASHFLNEYVSFACTSGAIVHSGFAFACLWLLLDGRYGILRTLSERHLPRYARVFITGHGRGAALATLTHAFLHYAMLFASNRDVFGLADCQYRLKSYVFGQPKPGDARFAADFASITQRFDNALVINNMLDAVPQVPLTQQNLEDVGGELCGESWMMWTLQHLAGLSLGVRCALGRLTEPLVIRSPQGYGDYFNSLAIGHMGRKVPARSWNFQPAGHVLYVFGRPGIKEDPFFQHHVWTYRGLLREQMR